MESLVGKIVDLESSDQSWLVQPKLEKFKINLERINEVGKILFKLGRSIKVNRITENQFWHNFGVTFDYEIFKCRDTFQLR